MAHVGAVDDDTPGFMYLGERNGMQVAWIRHHLHNFRDHLAMAPSDCHLDSIPSECAQHFFFAESIGLYWAEPQNGRIPKPL